MTSKLSRFNLWTIILIFALGFACYGNTLNGPFVFDDGENIVDNGYIRIHNLSPAALTDAAFKSNIPSRPIANISFALNYWFHGYWLPGYHFTNILIHCLTALLLFFFIKGTFDTPALRQLLPAGTTSQISAASTLLWLLNPLDTQSVSYIVQRMNSLSAMFFMLSMLFYLKARTNQNQRFGFYFACLLSGGLALGTKEIAATLPVILFIYEWYFFQDLDRGWLRRKLPWLAGAAVTIFVIGWLYLDGNFSSILAGYQSRDFTLGQRLLTEPRVVCRYLALSFFPWPGSLNLDHDYLLSTGLLEPPTTILAIAALLAIFLGAILWARQQRFLSFAILWFFLNLVIESSIIPLEIIFDHRTYLPSMLIWPPLLTMVWQLPGRKKQIALTAVIALLVLFAAWTIQRNQLWADGVALHRDIVLKNPRSARTHASLGRILINSPQGQQQEEGVRELEYAIGLNPNYGFSYLLLGTFYLKEGLYNKAITNLRVARRLMPNYDNTHYYLSQAYFKNNQYPEAVAAAKDVIHNPAFREKALLTLGLASSETGDLETAITSFSELANNHPGNGRYRFNLGRALENNGQQGLAMQKYEEALAIAADNDKLVIQMAINALRKDLHQGGSH